MKNMKPLEKIYFWIILIFMYLPILTLIVLTLNLIGDGLRDALDPRLKK